MDAIINIMALFDDNVQRQNELKSIINLMNNSSVFKPKKLPQLENTKILSRSQEEEIKNIFKKLKEGKVMDLIRYYFTNS